MTDTTPTPADRPADQLRAAAVWVDGDPLMEAMAAAVYEQCDKHPEVSVTIDDPRTIAAVAATVARQLLGSNAAESESGCAHCGSPDHAWDDCAAYTALVRDDAAAPPAPADRAATGMRDRIARALEREDSRNWGYDHGFENRYGVDKETDAFVDAVFAALANDAAAGVQPPTTTADRAAARGLFAGTAIRVADALKEPDAGVQPPTSEAEPARRRLTPNEYDRAWHAVEGSAGEEGADPGTVLHAVLRALRIDAPTPAEEQAASPSRRTTPPAAPAAPEETQ